MAENNTNTVAETIVQESARYRLWSMLFGCILSLVLIAAGIWFTQRGMGGLSAAGASGSGELVAKAGMFQFAAKNTAPGLILIICGSWIAVATIKRRARSRTQWGDNQHPGFTEVDG